MARPLFVLLIWIALPACAGLWPGDPAERSTTLQFLRPGSASECVVLRTQGDRVVVLFLTDCPRPEGLAAFLTPRGLSSVSEVVFTVAPREVVSFPAELEWERFRCTPDAVGMVTACSPRAALEVLPVTERQEVRIPGMILRLVPAGAQGDRLLVDIRHAGNRLVLVPVTRSTREDLAEAAAQAPIDLVGLLPAAKVGELLGVPGLERSRFLVRGPLDRPATERSQTIPLDERKRLLFQSAGDGLIALSLPLDLDT